jgi:hypothetical protein
MPPVSLVESASLTGQYVSVESGRDTTDLPAGMTYTFPPETAQPQRKTQKRSAS